MTTTLQKQHLPKFAALTSEQIERVGKCVERAYGKPMNGFADWSIPTGSDLFYACQTIGFDQAQVVLALAAESDIIGRGAIECLVGKPIAPWIPPSLSWHTPGPLPLPLPHKKKAVLKVPIVNTPKAAFGADLRVLISKADNPKTKGSLAWTRYELWKIGDTVQAARARGVTLSSVQKDINRGWLVLGPPTIGR